MEICISNNMNTALRDFKSMHPTVLSKFTMRIHSQNNAQVMRHKLEMCNLIQPNETKQIS